MSHDNSIESLPRIALSETDAVIRSTTRTTPVVAKILGRETKGGEERVWLDRRVHNIAPKGFEEGWIGKGAISTVLVRQIQ